MLPWCLCWWVLPFVKQEFMETCSHTHTDTFQSLQACSVTVRLLERHRNTHFSICTSGSTHWDNGTNYFQSLIPVQLHSISRPCLPNIWTTNTQVSHHISNIHIHIVTVRSIHIPDSTTKYKYQYAAHFDVLFLMIFLIFSLLFYSKTTNIFLVIMWKKPRPEWQFTQRMEACSLLLYVSLQCGTTSYSSVYIVPSYCVTVSLLTWSTNKDQEHSSSFLSNSPQPQPKTLCVLDFTCWTGACWQELQSTKDLDSKIKLNQLLSKGNQWVQHTKPPQTHTDQLTRVMLPVGVWNSSLGFTSVTFGSQTGSSCVLTLRHFRDFYIYIKTEVLMSITLTFIYI